MCFAASACRSCCCPFPATTTVLCPIPQFCRNAQKPAPARRKTARKPSEIPLNTGEGLRAAYYVQDDAASYSSLKEHVHQIDLLFPQWLHVDSPQGTLMMMSGDNLREYPVIQGTTVHDPDYVNKVKQVIQEAHTDTEIFPALNNFNPHTQDWDTGVGDVLQDPAKSASFLRQIMRFLAAYPAYRGLSLDIESIPDEDDAAYLNFIQALYSQMHARNLTPVRERGRGHQRQRPEDHRRQLRRHCADELRRAPDHQRSRSRGQPVLVHRQSASACSRSCPRKSSSARMGNYGYDWTLSIPDPKDRRHPKPKVVSTEDLCRSPMHGGAPPTPTPISISTTTPSILTTNTSMRTRISATSFGSSTRSPLLDEMRAARQLGLQTFALWRLGEEDSSLWNIWDRPSNPDSLQALGIVAAGP